MSKFSRSDVRRFIYEMSSIPTLNEEVEFLGNKLDIVDGKIIFNDKSFELTSGPFTIPVLNLSDNDGILSVTIDPPFVPFKSDGEPVTSTIVDKKKIEALINGFKSGKTFNIEVNDKDGKPQELTFASVG